MLRADSDPLRHERGTLGLVAGPGDDLTRLRTRARTLAGQGWKVRILAVDLPGGGDREVEHLDLEAIPPAFRVASVHGDSPCERSDRVRLALERFDFDVVEFPTRGALGFRAIHARRAGLAFANTRLAVRLDTATAWQRQQAGRWPDDPADLELDFAERQAFEQACLQSMPCPAALARARQEGWEFHTGPRPSPPTGHDPLVTVCVPHYNLGRHLPATLESLAGQTYPHLEVLVIDDGSTDGGSRDCFDAMEARFPRFRFLRQANAGIGATRNRGLALTRGEYFLPFDADNLATPHLVERLVHAARRRPGSAVLACYFLAFAREEDLARGRFLYAYRPTGGPRVLGCLRNVYGDATALYRTDTFRAVGGYETDRGTSFEDWEAFVKLACAGHTIEVVPEHLFYYRHLSTGFSRTTSVFANHERVLRRFRLLERLPEADREHLWSTLAGMHQRMQHQTALLQSRRFRIADSLYSACRGLLRWRGRTGGC